MAVASVARVVCVRPRASSGTKARSSATWRHGARLHHEAARSTFYMPPVVHTGPGSCATALREELPRLGVSDVLVVTDRALVDAGVVAAVTDVLDDLGVAYRVFDDVRPNPTDDTVASGVRLATSHIEAATAGRGAGIDGIVSVGGGSPHDAAKAIGAVLASRGEMQIHDMEGVDKVPAKLLPLVSVNTTAGTAAELTRFAVITDTSRQPHVKMAIVDHKLTPAVAVDDPQLMESLPAHVTAATGMDALTHAIEAFFSSQSTAITDACALGAVRLIVAHLRAAVEDGSDMEAREQLAQAQVLAGMAFNSAGLGFVHATSHQLGGCYDLPHGVCNAIMLPTVLELVVAPAAPQLFLDLAEAMGLDDPPSTEAAVDACVGAIAALARDVGIPPNLKALGPVDPDEFPVLAANALLDACGATSPVQPTEEELVEVYRAAYGA